MEIQILNRGAFGSALVHLRPGEEFLSESGAFYRSSDNIDIDVTTKTRGKGGFLRGLKRLIGGDSFFLSRYSVTDDRPAEVGLVPTLQGEVQAVSVDQDHPWLCTGGSYLGSSVGLEVDTRFQGFRGLFGGESLFFLRVHGEGELLVSAFGRIQEVAVQGGLVVDTGHVVAFQEGLQYSLSKAGGSWVQSFLGGEGIVLTFEGEGRVLVQSHNPVEFGKRLGRLLPPRSG